ncbi:alpha/beta fold hydrolase [Vibrio lentus]
MLSLLKSTVLNDCHLITFSMGSYLAMKSIIDTTNGVKSLVIISSDLSALSEDEIQTRKSILQWLDSNQYTGMSRRRADKFVSHHNEDYQNVLDTLLLMDRELGEDVLKMQLNETTERRSLIGHLSEIDIPVLIVAGKEDKFIDIDALSILIHQTEHCQISLIDNCIHMVPLEKPKELAALINKFYKDNRFV